MTKLWTGITLWKTRLKANLYVVILDEIMCKIECEHKNINALMNSYKAYDVRWIKF
jgi:hypothetical protein